MAHKRNKPLQKCFTPVDLFSDAFQLLGFGTLLAHLDGGAKIRK